MLQFTFLFMPISSTSVWKSLFGGWGLALFFLRNTIKLCLWCHPHPPSSVTLKVRYVWSNSCLDFVYFSDFCAVELIKIGGVFALSSLKTVLSDGLNTGGFLKTHTLRHLYITFSSCNLILLHTIKTYLKRWSGNMWPSRFCWTIPSISPSSRAKGV